MRTAANRVALGAALVIALQACASPSTLPDSLYGKWVGGNSSVTSVEFSQGGRIEINDGVCVGSYRLSAMNETEAILDTGYIRCPLMDGYIFDAAITVSDGRLVIDGAVINGEYSRG